MKKCFLIFAIIATGVLSVHAQTVSEEVVTVNQTSKEMQEDLQQVLSPTFGDYYEGLTKKITFDRMIPPYGLEVTFDKTTHIIFPSSIRYVDLGSSNIIAGKAGS